MSRVPSVFSGTLGPSIGEGVLETNDGFIFCWILNLPTTRSGPRTVYNHPVSCVVRMELIALTYAKHFRHDDNRLIKLPWQLYARKKYCLEVKEKNEIISPPSAQHIIH